MSLVIEDAYVEGARALELLLSPTLRCGPGTQPSSGAPSGVFTRGPVETPALPLHRRFAIVRVTGEPPSAATLRARFRGVRLLTILDDPPREGADLGDACIPSPHAIREWARWVARRQVSLDCVVDLEWPETRRSWPDDLVFEVVERGRPYWNCAAIGLVLAATEDPSHGAVALTLGRSVRTIERVSRELREAIDFRGSLADLCLDLMKRLAHTRRSRLASSRTTSPLAWSARVERGN